MDCSRLVGAHCRRHFPPGNLFIAEPNVSRRSLGTGGLPSLYRIEQFRQANKSLPANLPVGLHIQSVVLASPPVKGKVSIRDD